MNKTEVKKMLKAAGFTGKIQFKKSGEFGETDTFGPAIHRRWIDPEHDKSEVMYSVDRDGFETVVIYLEPKSYYYYREVLQNPKHVWTEGEINGLRKQLGYCSSWSKVCRNEMVDHLLTKYEFPKFRITKEQSKFGIEWLKRSQFKLNGDIRAGAFIGRTEAEVIKNFSRFEFVGLNFENYNQYSETYQTIAPVYRTIAKDGKSFSYTVSPMGGFGAQYEVVS